MLGPIAAALAQRKVMIWFVTLVAYWSAFFVAGIISTVFGMLVLTKINSKLFGCGTLLLLLFGSYLGLFGLTYVLVPQDYWNPVYDPAEIELEAFLEDISPTLYQQIRELRGKQNAAREKIKQFKKLRRRRPNFAERVDLEIAKWEQLDASITKALDEIHQRSEMALVDYKIDEISGREKFSRISTDLQTKAGRVLELAEVLQTSIENTSPSKNDQPDEVQSLEQLLNEIE